MESKSTPQAETIPTSAGEGLPEVMRQRFNEALAEAHTQANAEATRMRTPIGIAMDRIIKTVFNVTDGSGANPSNATISAYRRDHARLWAAGATPLDCASTRSHFDRLRSACRFVELDEIRRIRSLAEAARKAKDLDAMRDLTRQAFERATVYRVLYIDPDRPTWAIKSAALLAAGVRHVSKSKRKAGRCALSPDRLLVALGNQRKRCVRVEIFCMVFALFGIRPAELTQGVVMEITPTGLRIAVSGAKVDDTRGQPFRVLEVEATRRGLSGLAVTFLRAYVEENGGDVCATSADLTAVRRAMRQIQPGLSPYAYRHARSSDVKASHGRAEVAAWLGHANDRTQSGYGNARSSRGAVAIKAATASRPVRNTKMLPATISERISSLASRLTHPNRAPAQSPPVTLRRHRRGPAPPW